MRKIFFCFIILLLFSFCACNKEDPVNLQENISTQDYQDKLFENLDTLNYIEDNEIVETNTEIEKKEQNREEISSIDEGLVNLIKHKLDSKCSWEELEGIEWHPIENLMDAENGNNDDLYFDIDNDKIKNKIKYFMGTALSSCEIFYGQDSGEFIKGNLNGGLYDDSIPLSERDETEGSVGTLKFLTYKNINYMISIYDNGTNITFIDVYLYKNTDLIEKLRLQRKLNGQRIQTEFFKNESIDNILEIEGKEILKDYNDCFYPKVCFGTAEIETEGKEWGWTSYYTKCDINNDGVDEYCLKYNVGGIGENFEYQINENLSYLDKYGLTSDKIGELKGFWLDKLDDKNVLKLIAYKDNKFYFRCYLIEYNVTTELFSMSCASECEILVENIK